MQWILSIALLYLYDLDNTFCLKMSLIASVQNKNFFSVRVTHVPMIVQTGRACFRYKKILLHNEKNCFINSRIVLWFEIFQNAAALPIFLRRLLLLLLLPLPYFSLSSFSFFLYFFIVFIQLHLQYVLARFFSWKF